MIDFLAPLTQEYLGSPVRVQRQLIDEILRPDIYNQTTTVDPNGTYRQIETIVIDPATALTAGDNKVTITVPFDGTLVSTHAFITTVSSSGVVQVSLQDKNNNDVLAGILEIDANENGSETATNQSLVDVRYEEFSRYDIIKVNVDAIGTGSKGLVVQLYFIVTKFYYS